jgi:Ice-binding-like
VAKWKLHKQERSEEKKKERKEHDMKPLTIFILVLSSFGIGANAQTNTDTVKINLGTADKFALLGASGITNTSAQTYIIGDVGSSPTPTITGLTKSQVKGHLFLKSSPVTARAQKDLTVAYGEAAGAQCGTDLTGKDLGEMRLGPGVYCFSSSAGLTGTLTLDAHGNPNSQWVFQIGSTLTTATNSKVAMVLGHRQPQPLWSKGLRGCNVYWQVGSSATIGTGSIFVGKILALTSITLNGGTFRGKSLASNGAITMSAQETVDGPPCD